MKKLADALRDKIIPKLRELMEYLEIKSIVIEPEGLRKIKITLFEENFLLSEKKGWEQQGDSEWLSRTALEEPQEHLLPITTAFHEKVEELQSIVNIIEKSNLYTFQYHKKILLEKRLK